MATDALDWYPRLAIDFEAGSPATHDRRGRETRPTRPARVRVGFGPGIGPHFTADPRKLEAYAQRLHEAAVALRAEQRADAGHHDPDQLQLALDERTSAA